MAGGGCIARVDPDNHDLAPDADDVVPGLVTELATRVPM